jgi:hypothetical protein
LQDSLCLRSRRLSAAAVFQEIEQTERTNEQAQVHKQDAENAIAPEEVRAALLQSRMCVCIGQFIIVALLESLQ